MNVHLPTIDQCQYYLYLKNNGKVDVWSVDKLHAKAQHFIWISVWVLEGKINPYGIDYSVG